jgi:uncharacterized protein YtpQ (UPF0354 family)
MGIPWWGWIVIGLVAFVLLGRRAAASYRAGLRRELREYLQESRPDLKVVEETNDAFQLADAEGQDAGTLFLRRLYVEAPREEEHKRALFEKLVATLSENDAVMNLSPDHRERVMPRVITERMLTALRQQIGQDFPAVSLNVGGLSAVFVLDSENSVAFLGANQLAQLDLDTESALSTAKENLARSFGPRAVRQAVEDGQLHVIKSFDTYDAARLLLVPGYLQTGETLVAMIPDRDTLVLTPPPGDGNWASFRKLAKNAAGEPLYASPLLVTPDGLSVAPG